MKIKMTMEMGRGGISIKVLDYQLEGPLPLRRDSDKDHIIPLSAIYSGMSHEGLARSASGSLYSKMFYLQRTQALRLLGDLIDEGIKRLSTGRDVGTLTMTGVLTDVSGTDEVSFIES